ncbi:unnamed protein product, partial [Symbiodinium sp. CCMP2456]
FGADPVKSRADPMSCPVVTSAPEHVNHIRAVVEPHFEDIILDSGADISALPDSYASVGEATESPAQKFVDASGRLLKSKGVRIAEVQIGALRFKERFLVGGVTCPFLSLGKLYKAGFYVVPSASSPGGFILTDGSLQEPVKLERQSLCDPLLRLDASGWQRTGHRQCALLSFGDAFVDTTLIPLSELMWFRTTLVCRGGGGGEWSLLEFAEDVSSMSDRAKTFDHQDVEQVITIAHDDRTLSPAQLGSATPVDEPSPAPEASGVSPAQASPVPVDESSGVPPPEADDGSGIGDDPLQPSNQAAPVAPEGGEAPPAEREAIETETVSGEATSATLHCGSCVLRLFPLGLARMAPKASAGTDWFGTSVKPSCSTLRAETSRPPSAPPIAQVPSDADRAQHALTHEPYAPWCDTCVRFRGRQDQHATEASHGDGSRSVLSFDFGYCSREAPDDGKEARDRLTVLFLHDRRTKAVHAIPTLQKAGSSLTHLVTEAARFAVWTGHRSLGFRCDNEPAILAFQTGLLKALRNLGLDVSRDNSPIESHQSNGPVEQVVCSVRQHAAALMHDLQKACGATDGQVLFSPQHPIYGWSLCHACWLRNRYTPMHGVTPYEAVTDSTYSGTICRFGEKVLGYLKPDGKSSARWRHGLWLGKAVGADTHVVGMPGGVFVTRSVRRFSDNFDTELAASFDVCVWEHGLSSIGGKLVLGRKKPAAPSALPVPAYVGPPDGADKHEAEAVAPHSPSDIAGTDSPPSLPVSPSVPSSSISDEQVDDEVANEAGNADAVPESSSRGAESSPAPVITERLDLSENPRP